MDKRKRAIIMAGIMMSAGASGLLCSSRVLAADEPGTPITISKKVDMDINDIDVPIATNGVLVLSATDGLPSIFHNKIIDPNAISYMAAAEFAVSGLPTYIYTITLPGSAILSDGSNHSLKVSSFNSSPSVTGTLDQGGVQTLKVGATFHIAARQAAGTYINATELPVTVNYN